MRHLRASQPLQLVHSDLCQVDDLSLGKARYFITFLDDFSRKILIFFLKSKDETPRVVEEFINLSENQADKRMKILRTDNGREYLNATLKATLDKNGIKHELESPTILNPMAEQSALTECYWKRRGIYCWMPTYLTNFRQKPYLPLSTYLTVPQKGDQEDGHPRSYEPIKNQIYLIFEFLVAEQQCIHPSIKERRWTHQVSQQ